MNPEEVRMDLAPLPTAMPADVCIADIRGTVEHIVTVYADAGAVAMLFVAARLLRRVAAETNPEYVANPPAELATTAALGVGAPEHGELWPRGDADFVRCSIVRAHLGTCANWLRVFLKRHPDIRVLRGPEGRITKVNLSDMWRALKTEGSSVLPHKPETHHAPASAGI